MKKRSDFVKKLVLIAVLTSVTVVLQIIAIPSRSFLPFSITFSLFPIVIGAALCGPVAGAWLGFSFGVTVLLSGDAAAFLAINPAGAIITVLLKGTLAGLAAGLIYTVASKICKNVYFRVFCAALIAPIVNTGIFLLGCKFFFMDTISSWAEAAGSSSVGAYILGAFIGINFIIEICVNIVFCPFIMRILRIRKAG